MLRKRTQLTSSEERKDLDGRGESADDASTSKERKDGGEANTPRCRQSVVVCLIHLFCFFTVLSFLDHAFCSYGGNAKISQRGGKIKQRKADSESGAHFAVVMNTYKRPDMLRQAVQHYGKKCGVEGGIQQVFIVWAEDQDPPLPQSLFDDEVYVNIRGIQQGRDIDNRSDVHFIRVKDSLNNRFLPIDNLKGDAVFMVDDDIQITCRALQESHSAWKANKDALVGYFPRTHSIRSENIVYHTWLGVYLSKNFSIILTKACFLHKKYMAMYSSDEHPQAIRDYVDKKVNCEDIAMAMLVSNATKDNDNLMHMIYTEGPAYDTGIFGGISMGSGHFASRTQCLTDLSRIYEEHGWGVPLYNVPLADNSWLKHFPGYSWQVQPSGIFEWFPSADLFQ